VFSKEGVLRPTRGRGSGFREDGRERTEKTERTEKLG